MKDRSEMSHAERLAASWDAAPEGAEYLDCGWGDWVKLVDGKAVYKNYRRLDRDWQPFEGSLTFPSMMPKAQANRLRRDMGWPEIP